MTLLLGFGLTGCATTQAFQERLQAWVGQDVNELFEQKGPPTSSFKMPSGKTMYTYSTSSAPVYVRQFRNQVVTEQYWCSITFIVSSDQRIEKWQWKGNGCRA